MRIISYGGGVQSTAMLVLAIQGRIEADCALMANVGDDSEHPDSLRYLREIAQPWAASHGFTIHELHPTRRGEPTTIMREITIHKRDIIPMFGEAGNPLSRTCTADFKVRTLHRWLRDNGATKKQPATVLLGISTDEIERAGRGKNGTVEIREYPLLTLGLNRTDCAQIIKDAGLPVPPKSSCYFCPYHSETVWRELRRDRPDLFAQAQHLEDTIQQHKIANNTRQVYLTRKGARHQQRISEIIATAGDQLFTDEIGSDGCDSGYCWT